MPLDQVFTLAHDSEFRTLVAFGGPPRAGRVLALEPTGQVRIEVDDPDGGDVLAWPLNGAAYAVDDIVYCLFAANSPDSAIVLGAKGSAPGFALLAASEVRAVDAAGVKLTDDAGTLGLAVADGGWVGVGTAAPASGLDVVGLGLGREVRIRAGDGDAALRLMDTRVGGLEYLFQYAATLGHFRIRGGGLLSDAFVIKDLTNYVGVGTASPRGRLHVADSLASVLLWSNAAVGSTPVTIVPDAAGDVQSRVALLYVVENGGTSVAGLTHVGIGGTSDVVAGAGTFRFAVSAGGAFSVARSAGTGTARVALLALWI